MSLPTIDDDDVFELTNIKVQEVSLVDRAANQRKFLVVKRDNKKGTGDAITTDDVAKAAERAAENMADTPAAELDRRDAEAAAAAKAEPVAVEIAVVAETVNVASVAAADEVVVTTEPAVKSEVDVVVTEGSDGVNISVIATPSFAENSIESMLLAKVKLAWIGVIDAIRLRLDAMTEAVNKPSDGNYVSWEAYSHIDYIDCMLDSFWSIGGPEWDCAVAAMAAATAKSESSKRQHEELSKIGKSIEGARSKGLKDIQSRMAELTKMFDSVVAGVPAEVVATKAEDIIAKAVQVVEETKVDIKKDATPVVESKPVVLDISQDPAFKALAETLNSQTAVIETLKAQLTNQEQTIKKARATVHSNALSLDESVGHNEVKWDRDMASPSSRVSSRARR